ncbi:MAG: mechanosensitive ion channel [Clostridia bacterium]|nr:mechanosensitive ion channel [Clostridia bacterium]
MESMENITESVTEAVAQKDPEIGKVVSALGDVTMNMLLQTLLTFAVGMVLIHLILVSVRRIIERFPSVDKTISGFLISCVRVILLLILITICFSTLGIPVTSLVAVISMFALAVSLSMQSILSNMVSGIVILLTRPFKVGDWIETPNTSGTVEKIDLIYTHLLAADLKKIVVPNSELSASRITNYSNVKYRKVILNVRVGYEADNKKVIAALIRAAEKAIKGRDVGAEKSFAATNAYKDDGVEYILRVPVLTKEYWDVYYDLLIRIREELANDMIEMDYAATKVIGSVPAGTR